jgi:hypothetical protein
MVSVATIFTLGEHGVYYYHLTVLDYPYKYTGIYIFCYFDLDKYSK